jgi:hypothetical protein
MSTRANEPAMPVGHYVSRDYRSLHGLTIREQFALTLTAAIVANPNATTACGNAHILGCELADNLLRQLERTP